MIIKNLGKLAYRINFKEIILNGMNSLKIPEMYMNIRKKLIGHHAVIFLYHRVCPEEERALVANVSPEEFEKQMIHLKKYFRFFSLEELVEIINEPDGKIRQLGNIAVVTFDDGYKDNYVYAYPILNKYKIPATIFLPYDYIGQEDLFWWDKIGYIIYHSKNKNVDIKNIGSFSLDNEKKKLNCIHFLLRKLKKMGDDLREEYINELKNKCDVKIPSGLGRDMILSWDDINEMKCNGITFGAHTLSHANLKNIDLKIAKKEISHSKNKIEEKLEREVNAFAYPYGSKFYNQEIIKLVKNSRFNCAVSTDEKLLHPFRVGNIYNLPRISAGNSYRSFTLKSSGIFSDINNIFHFY